LEEQLQEAMEVLSSQSREITDVYVRLGRAEERIALQSRALEALNNPAAPPTTTAASTQTEDPSPLSAMLLAPNPPTAPVDTTAALTQKGDVPMAEGSTMPLGEDVGRPSAMPPALNTQTPAAPLSTAPLPTIEVQGPTPLNSQEGDKAASLLPVPLAPAPALSAAISGSPRQSQSRTRSPAPNPADCRRSPRLATPIPSVVAAPSPQEPRHSPRIAMPSPASGSRKRSSPPADKEPPAKKCRV
jgi:hypothetical protein